MVFEQDVTPTITQFRKTFRLDGICQALDVAIKGHGHGIRQTRNHQINSRNTLG
jgi:hypothetical protein